MVRHSAPQHLSGCFLLCCSCSGNETQLVHQLILSYDIKVTCIGAEEMAQW